MVELGTLCLAGLKDDTFTLTIGNHLLEGKLVHLKRPFVVLQKEQQPASVTSTGVAYKGLGIIRSKLQFKNRPKPLISKPGSVTHA
ncbi:hypothetical protein WJX72_000958 [[Myrmecia] bisecta]|uniref:Chromosome transmission fidelity protein 8 n=1 Tax=[Myrmecia] bisecta TaxID=41462 RepID=A0AAW1PDS0_9CHLO